MALDPEARLLHLGDARDPLPLAALVARDALGAGRGYWEVELGRARSWALGVLRDPPDPRDPHNSRDLPWLWALCASQGRLFSASRALGNHPRDLSVLGNHPRDLSVLGNHPGDLSVLMEHPRDLSVLGEHPRDLSVLGNHPRDLSVLAEHPRDLSVLGVFLHREKARLEFYDAERRHLLAGISLQDPPGHRDPLAGISLRDPPGRFFPFVSRGEEGALRIRPVPVPEPIPGPGPL